MEKCRLTSDNGTCLFSSPTTYSYWNATASLTFFYLEYLRDSFFNSCPHEPLFSLCFHKSSSKRDRFSSSNNFCINIEKAVVLSSSHSLNVLTASAKRSSRICTSRVNRPRNASKLSRFARRRFVSSVNNHWCPVKILV